MSNVFDFYRELEATIAPFRPSRDTRTGGAIFTMRELIDRYKNHTKYRQGSCMLWRGSDWRCNVTLAGSSPKSRRPLDNVGATKKRRKQETRTDTKARIRRHRGTVEESRRDELEGCSGIDETR